MLSPYRDEYYQRRMHSKFSLSKEIPEVLRRDFGFSTLPDQFVKLNRLFNEMEKVLQISYGRDQRMTFSQLASNVEKNCKSKVTLEHLAQINSIYPDAFTLKWEKQRNKRGVASEQWDLVIKQNVQGDKDLKPFLPKKIVDAGENSMAKGELAAPLLPPSPVKLISPIKARRERDFILRSPIKKVPSVAMCSSIPDTRVKMDANRMKWRKMIFRHLLVSRVREAHKNFLRKENLSHADDKSLHPAFKEAINNLVSEIPNKLPEKPFGAELRDTDIRTFLQSQTPKTPRAKRERTPDCSLMKLVKSEPQTPIRGSCAKVEPHTPKTPLEQRLETKFAAKAASRSVDFSLLQKRRGMLYRLKDDLLEVIRTHMNLNKCLTVGLSNRELLQKMGRRIDCVSLFEHLELLCELVPNGICWIESLDAKSSGPYEHFFKVSADAGPGWLSSVQNFIENEIRILDERLNPLLVTKSLPNLSSD